MGYICYLEHCGFGPNELILDTNTSSPAILLTNTTWWPCASRLAIALTKAGCRVSAVYPANGHALAKTAVLHQRHVYGALRPLDSLAEAIRRIHPHLVVPCDDRAVQHLHELYSRERGVRGSGVPALIERSLGDPASYPIAIARYPLLKTALELGLPVPETDLAVAGQVPSSWPGQHQFPWVVKADGTWGGHGTRFVTSLEQCQKTIRQMSKPLSTHRAIKRLLVDRDPYSILPWRTGSTSQVVIQSHVQGHPANCAVFCWKGRVLAGIAVEVVCALSETGSATIAREVSDPGMIRTAAQLVERLGLSGFLGFDFVIEAGSGTAYLIEMNPRLTPLGHLRLGPNRDLVAAVVGQVTGKPLVAPPPSIENKMIAYFPQAWHSDGCKDLLSSSFQDVPWEDPLLVRDLLRLPWPDRSMLARFSAGLRQRVFLQRKAAGVVFQSAIPKSAMVPHAAPFSADPRQPPAVVPLCENGRKPPLFVIHGVDGQIDRFYALIRHLDADQPVYGILSQALMGERIALTRVEQLAEYYLRQVQAVQPRGPYCLLGYSFGGFVAFEMARQLELRGALVGIAGMIDTLPMGVGWNVPAIENDPSGSNYPRNQGTSRLASHARKMLQSGGFSYAMGKLRARGLRIIYTCLDVVGLPIPAFLRSAPDINWFAAVRYAPQPFSGKVTLFYTAASRERGIPTHELWSGLTGGNVEIHEIAGRHENIFSEPQVASLAGEVTACLAKAQ